MYYDEAINTLRMDATFGLPVRRSIRRLGWEGKWIEWLDGHVTVGIDRELTLPPVGDPLISTEDLSARDWIVEESR